ncbi:MAG TPA: acyl-CoA dehydrogenase [Crenotrichaceae bacterium]|nr:acyl-CoA dehydrogenase [Crenotrichaceae bacterium]
MNWNEQQLALQNTVSQLGAELSKHHIEWDRRAEFPREKWQLISKSGVLGLLFPEQYGGTGQDLLTSMGVLEQLGHCCEDAGLNFVTSTQIVSIGIPLLRFGTDALKQKYLPDICSGERICAHAITEPSGGSDAFNMSTTAIFENDKYILNGSKAFISNGPIADLFAVYLLSDKNKGVMGGSSVFLVERGTPGFEIGEPIEKMGQRTSPLCELRFNNCEIPVDNLLGNIGMGFSILDYVMKHEVLCSFIINVGEMQRRLEKCIDYARNRKQFGQPIGSFQSVANKIVDMKIGVTQSREALYRAGKRVQNKQNATIDLAIAKLVTSENNVTSARDAIQIFGANGYMVEYGIEKDLRNAIAGTIYSGSSEIQRNRIASMIGL